MDSPIRIVRHLFAGLAIVFAVYLAAGLIGGAIPVNRDRRPPHDGVTIWVEDNGIHTGLVLPKLAAGVDWRPVFGAAGLRDPRYAGYDHVAIGWGDRGFYQGTPTWWDVRPWTVARAAIGSADTVLHVEHVARPVDAPLVWRVTLRPEEYRRLAAFVRGSLGRGAPVAGYVGYDAFYPATGRYGAIRTCNAWTGRALAAAGVRVGAWTPLPVTVGWWL